LGPKFGPNIEFHQKNNIFGKLILVPLRLILGGEWEEQFVFKTVIRDIEENS